MGRRRLHGRRRRCGAGGRGGGPRLTIPSHTRFRGYPGRFPLCSERFHNAPLRTHTHTHTRSRAAPVLHADARTRPPFYAYRTRSTLLFRADALRGPLTADQSPPTSAAAVGVRPRPSVHSAETVVPVTRLAFDRRSAFLAPPVRQLFIFLVYS